MSKTLKLLKEADINISQGMMNKFVKDSGSSGITCTNCGYVVPKYKGRYPSECPQCGLQLLRPEFTADKRAEITNDIPADINEAEIIKRKGYTLRKTTFKRLQLHAVFITDLDGPFVLWTKNRDNKTATRPLHRNEPEKFDKNTIVYAVQVDGEIGTGIIGSLNEAAPKEYDYIQTEMTTRRGEKYPIFIMYIDSTHVAVGMAKPSGKSTSGMGVYHIGQLRDEEYYDKMINWMKTGKLNESINLPRSREEGAIKTGEMIASIERAIVKLDREYTKNGVTSEPEDIIDDLMKQNPKWKSNKNIIKKMVYDFYGLDEALSINKDEDQFRYLYRLAKDTSGRTYNEFEKFLKKHFPNWEKGNMVLPPHLSDILRKSKTEDDFINNIKKMGLDESKKVKLSNGMYNSFMKKYTTEDSSHCEGCGLVVPDYKGRKLSKCPNCGEGIVRPMGAGGAKGLVGDPSPAVSEDEYPAPPYGATADLDDYGTSKYNNMKESNLKEGSNYKEVDFKGKDLDDLRKVFKTFDDWNEEGFFILNTGLRVQFFVADFPKKNSDEVWVENWVNGMELKIKVSEIAIIEPYLKK